LLPFEIVTLVTAGVMHRTAKCFITFTPECFARAVAAVSVELRAILVNKICKILQFLCCFVNSAHDGQFCACWPILRTCRIL